MSNEKRKNIWPAVIFYVCFLMLSFSIICRGVDSDSYYMIAQGREILALKHVPKYNSFVYYPNFRIVVQQWLYCVIMKFLFDDIGKWAICMFGALQAMCLVIASEIFLRTYKCDKWIARFAAAFTSLAGFTYTLSMRPENITIILMIWEYLSLLKYKETEKTKYLWALPIGMFIEANIHCSMWIFHWCILAVFLVPPVFINKFTEDTHIKFDRPIALSVIGMILAGFLNPYGIDNIMYVFRSLRVFNYIDVLEQQPTAFFDEVGIRVLPILIIFILLFLAKKLRSHECWLCLGFLFLAMYNVHSSMYLGFPMLIICSKGMDYMIEKKAMLLENAVPKSAIIGLIAGVMIVVSISTVLFAVNYPEFGVVDIMDNIAEIIKDDPGNIVCGGDVGSYLEFKDVKGIMIDTRPELLLDTVNKNFNAATDFYFLTYGREFKDNDRYTTMSEYVDYYDIKYVIHHSEDLYNSCLYNYVEESDMWECVYAGVHHGSITSAPKSFALYKRK